MALVDRHSGVRRAAGRVHVEVDVFARLLRVEEEKLRGDQVGNVVVHLLAEKHDALAQEPRIDVERALVGARLLYHHWHDRSDQHGDLLL